MGWAECEIEQQQSRARATLTPLGSGGVPLARLCSSGAWAWWRRGRFWWPRALRGRPPLICVPFPGSSESSEFSEEMSSGLESASVAWLGLSPGSRRRCPGAGDQPHPPHPACRGLPRGSTGQRSPGAGRPLCTGWAWWGPALLWQGPLILGSRVVPGASPSGRAAKETLSTDSVWRCGSRKQKPGEMGLRWTRGSAWWGLRALHPLWPLADTHRPGRWGAKGSLPKVPCSQSVRPRKSSPVPPPPRWHFLCARHQVGSGAQGPCEQGAPATRCRRQ